MTEKLKPLSDAKRNLLALLGETPAAFQEKVMKVKLYGTKYLKALDTKDALWKVNKATLAKMDGTAPIQEVVKHMQETEEKAKAFTLSDWVPLHYTLFTRRIYCKFCRTWESSMEHGTIFLCHRKRGGASSERLYLPVKGISHHQLKRVIETSLSTTDFCPNCFLEVRPVWQESFSPPVDTESSRGEEASLKESTTTSSSLETTPSPPSDTSEAESAGSPASNTESQTEVPNSSNNMENSVSASLNPRLLPVLVSVYDFLTGSQKTVPFLNLGEA